MKNSKMTQIDSLLKDINDINPQNYTIREEVNLEKAKSTDYLIIDLLKKKYHIENMKIENNRTFDNGQAYFKLCFDFKNEKCNVWVEHINNKITKIQTSIE